MLGYLLVVLLQLNNIDYTFDAMNIAPVDQQAIINNFESSDYQTPYHINRYLSPIKKFRFFTT